MRGIALFMTASLTLAGCLPIEGPPDVAVAYHIGGRVHGLWNGTDGVALRLQADRVDAVVTVSTTGTFSFPDLLGAGTSYTVSVMGNPAKHACVIAGREIQIIGAVFIGGIRSPHLFLCPGNIVNMQDLPMINWC